MSEKLSDLTELLRQSEGFPGVLAALKRGRSASIDGAWGSSAALAAAALAQQAPQTVLVVLAHPRDVDPWSGDLVTFSATRPAMFPAWDNRPGTARVDEIAGQRLRLLRLLEAHPPRLLLTTMQALMQPVPDRKALTKNRRRLQIGANLDFEEFAVWLVDRGYRPADAVETPGEFSRRGGILDVYPPDAEAPFRLEFFGDEIESIRSFSPDTQRSLGNVTLLDVMGVSDPGDPGAESTPNSAAKITDTGNLCDFLPEGSWTILVEVEELTEQGRVYLDRVSDPVGLFDVPGVMRQLVRFPSVTISALPHSSTETVCQLRIESVERFSGEVTKVRDELDSVAADDDVLITCSSEAEIRRLGEVLAEGRLAKSGHLHLAIGRVRSGFRIVNAQKDGGVVILGGQELFRRDATFDPAAKAPRRRLESRAIDSFLDLAEGDLVVHVSHGIARYRGMQLLDRTANSGVPMAGARQAEEHLILEFRDGVRVYVPASKIDLVQKYVGGSKTDPELSKLGGTSWSHRKAKVQAAVMDLASDMIQMQALREAQPGFAFPPDSDWQAEFEGAFPFQETPDQLTSLAEIKSDLQRAAADGSAHLRRRRLRQNRTGHPRRLQSHRQWQAGRRPRADDGAGRATLPHLQRIAWPSILSSSSA